MTWDIRIIHLFSDLKFKEGTSHIKIIIYKFLQNLENDHSQQSTNHRQESSNIGRHYVK